MTASQVYLHSVSREFADTMLQSESAYLGRSLRQEGALRFLGCGCGSRGLVRIRRARWMQMLPGFRHYRCLDCGARVLRLRLRNRLGYGALYIGQLPLPRRGRHAGR